MTNDTICALATAPGGALSVIRVSGGESIKIVNNIFTKDLTKAAANTVHFGSIVASPLSSANGKASSEKSNEKVIDDVLVSVFRAPHSYTGEDSVEISCHGSQYIAKKILEQLVKNGCRMAEPGEYTMRAYLNGKMDLSQAEAVADLIASQNEATHKLAMSQLRGHLSTKLNDMREQLLHLTTLLELELDFSDHEDLEFADRSEIQALAETIKNHIEKLAKSFEQGQALKEGITVAIVGRTNVGKSTLLNKLLKDDKAIVSDIHGTTRDTVEDVIQIGGIAFRIIDTAGLRNTDDIIERIGIERTYSSIDKARIVLWLNDDIPSDEERKKIEELTRDKHLIEIYNKADLSDTEVGNKNGKLFISAKHGKGIELLEQALLQIANEFTLNEDDIIVTSTRHYSALCSALQNITRVTESLKAQISGDLVAEELRMVLHDLAEITGGQITSQEALNNIFHHFCVGK